MRWGVDLTPSSGGRLGSAFLGGNGGGRKAESGGL